jgi:mitogen-activated protein kinase kinase 1
MHMQPDADQRHPNALKPKKPRKPPGLAGLSLANLTPETSFVLTDTGTFQKGGFRINAAGVHDCPAKKGDLSSMALEQLEPLQTLGRGACGTVRLARHTPTGQLLALKAISIGDQSQRHQLLNELSVLVTLSHPNLVPLFDAFYLDGQVHIALGYMNGGSLEQLLAAYQELCQAQSGGAQLVGMPERILAHVLVQILCGLQHLHSQGVVHRDLKPANILFDTAGMVCVADFGIAKQLELELTTDAMARSFVGTAAYMAPERITGCEYSFGADVWAVGVVAVECALGHHPSRDLASQHEVVCELDMALAAANGASPPRLPPELFSSELCGLLP